MVGRLRPDSSMGRAGSAGRSLHQQTNAKEPEDASTAAHHVPHDSPFGQQRSGCARHERVDH